MILDTKVYCVGHDDPMAGVIGRVQAAAGDGKSTEELVRRWSQVDLGSAKGDMRYPWQLSHRRISLPEFCSPAEQWRPWRQAEQAMQIPHYEFEERYVTPIAICESAELLLSSGLDDGKELYRKLEPVFRRDLVKYALSESPWHDMFALRCLVGCKAFLAAMKPFALAIAGSYASLAERADGKVLGQRFPFHDKFLVSATSYLAQGLYATGTSLDLVASLYANVAGAVGPSGTWGDADAAPDIMSSLAAAELLLQVDPAFDPVQVVRFLEVNKNARGGWSAFGPDEPWLTLNVSAFLETAGRPFAERFVWPSLDVSDRDAKTGIANFGWFTTVADLLHAMPDLAKTTVQAAFIDLAGFKKFNDSHGQDAGDEVIRLFAQHLQTSDAVATIRDGGDEFLLIGAPTSRDLPAFIETVRTGWPEVFRKNFGDAVFVAPRIVWSEFKADGLRAARERLGQSVGVLKDRSKTPDPVGVVMKLDG